MTLDIPYADITEFHARKNAHALIIGVYNEGGKFTRQLASLQPFRDDIDIIIADGGSNDGAISVEVLRDKIHTLLVNQDNKRGLSVQYRSALHYALEQGYEGIIMMDGNGKDGVEAIPVFIDRLLAGYDFVQGSRFLPGGRHENTPADRLLGIRYVFNPLMFLGSGFWYSDAMNGFKGCSRSFLTDAQVQPFRDIFVRYNLQYYLNYIAPKLGKRITEIPVSRIYINDHAPHSKIIGFRARLSILKELFHTVLGHYTPR